MTLDNQHVANWHILDPVPKPDHIASRYWYSSHWCRCECGNQQLHRDQNLRRAMEGKRKLRVCTGCGR